VTKDLVFRFRNEILRRPVTSFLRYQRSRHGFAPCLSKIHELQELTFPLEGVWSPAACCWAHAKHARVEVIVISMMIPIASLLGMSKAHALQIIPLPQGSLDSSNSATVRKRINRGRTRGWMLTLFNRYQQAVCCSE
jgi:hypothetical protein